MATAAAAAATLVLLFVSLLPLGALCSRAGPSSHRSHSKHSPPPSSPPPPAPAPAPAAPQAAALVRATCNSTAYYDICVAALAADPSSTTADVRGLSAIAVSAAATNASASAAAAAALANATGPAADVTVQALLRTCAAKYADARDALGAARDSIAQQDYDYASVHVNAAAEYPQVCKTLFRRQRPGAYPAELAQREEALKQLCSVALDIISLLSSSS